jgi:hypothetical protein
MNPASRSFNPTPSESFTFQSSASVPFYSFSTSKLAPNDTSFSECLLQRHDPAKGSIISIMSHEIEPLSRRLPPQDGLVTLLYPKAAAMMAVDTKANPVSHSQAASNAKGKNRISRQLSTNTTQKCVVEAAEKECSRLLWDNEKKRYHLWHPGLNKGRGQSFAISIEGTVGFDIPGARGEIKISTSVEGKGQLTLASLEFGTAMLLVDTSASREVDSYYIVDVAVASLLAVALVEGRRLRQEGNGRAPLASGSGQARHAGMGGHAAFPPQPLSPVWSVHSLTSVQSPGFAPNRVQSPGLPPNGMRSPGLPGPPHHPPQQRMSYIQPTHANSSVVGLPPSNASRNSTLPSIQKSPEVTEREDLPKAAKGILGALKMVVTGVAVAASACAAVVVSISTGCGGKKRR